MRKTEMRRLSWALLAGVVALSVLVAMTGCRSSPRPPSTPTAGAASAQAVLTSTGAGSPTPGGAAANALRAGSGTPTPMPSPTPLPAPVQTRTIGAPLASAEAVVVVDERSGAVLYERNAHERRAPASVTKIATAIIAIEKGNPADRVSVDYDASELEDSTLMGVNPGDRVTLEDLLYGLMLPSGNEAALSIANHVSGSPARFVADMNDLVQRLGLQDTQFRNPHGLDAAGHYTSAYDIVMLARYGMTRYPLFARLSAARSYAVHGRTRDGERKDWEIFNLNRLVREYPGADGIKIGYTDAAGRTIVASATRNGHRVYVGLMGSADLWTDSRLLFDWVFDTFAWPQ